LRVDAAGTAYLAILSWAILDTWRNQRLCEVNTPSVIYEFHNYPFCYDVSRRKRIAKIPSHDCNNLSAWVALKARFTTKRDVREA